MALATRIATEADAAALARLNRLINDDSDLTAEQLGERLTACAGIETALVAEIDGRVVGFACVRITPSICFERPESELTVLIVDPDVRRQGAGRALVLHAERMARESGAHQLLIATGFKNTAAQQLYHGCGFENTALLLARRY